jgi:hypothetical protein
VAETLTKISLYFRRPETYWQLVSPEPATVVDAGPLGRYPLDLAPRLASGHFNRFDAMGLPLDPSRDGHGLIHNYTTVCAFALAHWDRYLRTGGEDSRQTLLAAAEYLMRTSDREESHSLRLRAELPGAGHVGQLSAMFQGEAISVLCRAWWATKASRYLDAAIACLAPFGVPVERGGVLGHVSACRYPWYEEHTAQPLRHILNGMIYALWGLRDLVVTADHCPARRLFEAGVESVAAVLPRFDTGFWSWYWIPEQGRCYIASMMYHNLHICQLTALARQTGIAELQTWADCFQTYARNARCRLRAAGSMLRAKWSRA